MDRRLFALLTARDSGGGIPMPSDGLVFYAPLSSLADKSEATGATWDDDPTYDNGYSLQYLSRVSPSSSTQSYPTLSTVSGVKCLLFDSNQYISVPDLLWNTWKHDQTFSWWVNFTVESKERGMIGDCSPSKYSDNFRMSVLATNKIETTFGNTPSGRINGTTVLSKDVWYHILVMLSGGGTQASCYLNGVLEGTASANGSTTKNEPFSIGRARDLTRGTISCQGYMAAVRIYNKALSNDEIQTLAHEFGG